MWHAIFKHRHGKLSAFKKTKHQAQVQFFVMHIFKHHAGAKKFMMLKIKHQFALQKNPNDAFETKPFLR